METRRIASPPAGLAPLSSARRRGQRPFILPRPGRDGDEEDNEEGGSDRAEPSEGEREAERTEHETTVSRELSDDESGHHIDVRG